MQNLCRFPLLLSSFRHRCLRELVWVMASPPLLSGEFEHNGFMTHWWTATACFNELMDCLPILQTLDKNPSVLISYLDALKSKRLGLRFEALIAFWLKDVSPNFTLLAQNIQLHEMAGNTRSRTIGEVDFIIREHRSNKVIHLEVAVKFYLGTSPFNDPYRWFGTNTKDQLGRKVDHLKYHQTQLLLQHHRQTGFAIDERHCFLKGRLFYPFTALSTEVSDVLPQGVAPHHLRGQYVFYGESHVSAQRSGQSVIQLEKKDWLAPLSSLDIEKRHERRVFPQEQRAFCYARIEKSRGGDREEVGRLFCLPDDFSFPAVRLLR